MWLLRGGWAWEPQLPQLSAALCKGESIGIGVGEAVPGGPSVPRERAVGWSHMAVGT